MNDKRELLKYGLAFLLFSSISTAYVFATGDNPDIVDDTSIPSQGHWYNEGWVWVVGTLVVILLLYALSRPGRKKMR